MNTTISYLLIAITLTLGLATPPVQAKALEPTPAPLWLSYNKMVDTMPLETIKPLESLKMADFKYAPMGTYSSSFEPANCTWGVASMKGNITWSGNAKDWDEQARAQGKVVSDVPVVGSVGVSNDGYYGHVVLTTSISGGMVQVMEMNWDNQGGVRSHWYPATQFVYIYI